MLFLSNSVCIQLCSYPYIPLFIFLAFLTGQKSKSDVTSLAFWCTVIGTKERERKVIQEPRIVSPCCCVDAVWVAGFMATARTQSNNKNIGGTEEILRTGQRGHKAAERRY